MGYNLAGFDVTGVDIKAQPRYPFKFIQGDVLEIASGLCQHFDFIHASPPCQFISKQTPMQYRCNHKNHISATREILKQSGKPYVIENVPSAKKYLIHPLMLCGTMFELKIQRHRLFEIEPQIAPPILGCDHSFYAILITGTPRRKGVKRADPSAEVKREAMQTPWMRIVDMDEAIPPVYTKWIGEQLLKVEKSNQK